MASRPWNRIDLAPFAYDPARRAWVTDHAPDVPAPSAKLTLVTWNVWFGSYQLEERFRAVLEIVRALDADILCFQEIVAESLAMLRDEPWIRASYQLSDAHGTTFDDYGTVLLSRLPIRSLLLHELPTGMGRALVAADIDALGGSVVVGTVHLESRKWNADRRAEQLEVVFPVLGAMGADCVLAGDFNFCSSWARENANLDPDFVDLWPALRGREPGYTEDSETNEMLRNIRRKDKQVRFDRVLLRAAGGRLRARSIERLGTAPIAPGAPDVFPSDHFGLAAVLERVK